MRKIFGLAVLLLLVVVLASAQDQYNDNPPPANNQDDYYYQDNNNNYDEDQDNNNGMSYQTFYDQLSPYGNWIYYPGRGYCWVPQVDNDFSPYLTNGHWVYTDAEWTWVSDYPWGWAAFHYGRWFFDAEYGGWLWSPGYQWGPAWVTWGEYGGFYCWAPLGWGEPLAGSIWAQRHWYFVHRDLICNEHLMNHVVVNRVDVDREVGVGTRISVINRSNTFNNTVFNAGPRREDVERYIGHNLNTVRINNEVKPGVVRITGNQVNIYRPTISRNINIEQRAVPGKLVRPEEVHNQIRPEINQNQPANVQPQRNFNGGQIEYHSNPTPPRQSAPTQPNQFHSSPQENTYRPQQQEFRQNEARPTGGFVPTTRPSGGFSGGNSFRSSGGGGGFHGGGGGRH